MNSTLSELLQGYRPSYVVKELHKRGFTTSRSTVYTWLAGGTPEVPVVVALADILRVDVGDLTRSIAREAVA